MAIFNPLGYKNDIALPSDLDLTVNIRQCCKSGIFKHKMTQLQLKIVILLSVLLPVRAQSDTAER